MGRYRRYFVALAIVGVLLGAYAAVGFLGVPYFARKTAVEFVRSHYRRALGIGEIRFNPFTLDLEVTKLALPDADGQRMLALERLDVDLQWASLWRLGPSFGRIALERPYVRAVMRRNGGVNLADLGKGFAAAPTKSQQPSAPLRLYIGRLAVISGTANFEDRTRPTPFSAEFKPIAFELRDFSTTRRTKDAYALNAASPEGERLIWSGTLRLEPLSSQGEFEIADLKARTIWNYLRASLPFELDSGVIAIKGDYELGSGGGPLGLKLNVRSTALTGLGVKPRGGTQDYINLARIEVDDTRVDVARHSVEVAKVALSGGDLKAWMSEQGRLNLLELLGAPPATGTARAAEAAPATDTAPAAGAAPAPQGATASSAPATAPPAAAPATAASGSGAPAWSVSAPQVTLQGFKVTAEDRQVHPAAALLLNPVNIHVVGFNLTPDATLDVTLDSGVNDSGKIDVRARVTPKSGAVSAHVESTNLGLTMLQPYIAQYTSMTLLKGALGTKLDIERDADGALTVKGSTQVSDLRTVGQRAPPGLHQVEELRVADIRYRSAPASLKVGNVTALEPYVRMIIAPDRSVNVSKVLTAPGAVPKAAAASPAAPATGKAPAAAPKNPPAPPAPLTPFPMSIGTIRFVNGSANYSDLLDQAELRARHPDSQRHGDRAVIRSEVACKDGARWQA